MMSQNRPAFLVWERRNPSVVDILTRIGIFSSTGIPNWEAEYSFPLLAYLKNLAPPVYQISFQGVPLMALYQR